MLKKITLMALAAVSMSAFAQSSSEDYTMNADNHWDRRTEVWKGIDLLSGGDRYYFEKWMGMLNGPQEHAVVKAIYNMRGMAHQMRWENGLARINTEWPTYAYNRTTTVQTTTDASGNVVSTTTTTTTTVPTNDMMVWDTQSDTARPLRYAYEMAKPRSIDYRSAIDILTANLSDTEKGIFTHTFMNAPERAKDILVRLIGRNLEWVDNLPPRVTYLDGIRAGR